MVTNKLLTLLDLCCVVFALLCDAQPTPVHDYIFAVTGVVTTDDGTPTPIADADITLEVNGPVYKGVELIKTVKFMADDTGGFVFTYTSHKRGVKYTITVPKEGFEPQSVSGNAPPAGHHTFRQKRASSDGPTSLHD